MENGNTHISTRKPQPPRDADFAIYIDFKKGEPNPQRVFQAADAMIRSFQKLDEALCDAVDCKIKPILVLEDIEIGSIKIWLKSILEEADDDALKTLDWKPQVGKYLVRAKYAYINWANKNPNGAHSIVDLSKEIQLIASQTDIKHMPAYKPPSVQDLIAVAEKIQQAKSYLNPEDKLSYISEEGSADFDLAVTWAPEELSQLITKETVIFPPAPMILAVKKPDYLGNSKWDFRHGKKTINAKITDEEWLVRFQNRQIDVRPGDALRCLVRIENGYGYDNELLIEHYTIEKIEDVLVNQYQHQVELFVDDN